MLFRSQVDIILHAVQVKGMNEADTNVLNDFARRLKNGWSLSDKQVAFMNALVQKAQKLEVEGPWTPNEEEKAAILQGLNHTKRYSSYYLGGRPGLSRAIHAAIAWQTRAMPLERYHAEMLMTVCKGERFAMKKDRKSTRLNSSHVSESRMPSSA